MPSIRFLNDGERYRVCLCHPSVVDGGGQVRPVRDLFDGSTTCACDASVGFVQVVGIVARDDGVVVFGIVSTISISRRLVELLESFFCGSSGARCVGGHDDKRLS